MRIGKWGGEMRTKKKGGEGMAMGDRMVPAVVAFLVLFNSVRGKLNGPSSVTHLTVNGYLFFNP